MVWMATPMRLLVVFVVLVVLPCVSAVGAISTDGQANVNVNADTAAGRLIITICMCQGSAGPGGPADRHTDRAARSEPPQASGFTSLKLTNHCMIREQFLGVG